MKFITIFTLIIICCSAANAAIDKDINENLIIDHKKNILIEKMNNSIRLLNSVLDFCDNRLNTISAYDINDYKYLIDEKTK